MAKPRRDFVVVEWDDAHSGTGRWQPLDEIEGCHEAVSCRSAGWVVADTEDVLVLVSSISGEANGNLRLYGSGDIVIPKGCITKKTRVKL